MAWLLHVEVVDFRLDPIPIELVIAKAAQGCRVVSHTDIKSVPSAEIAASGL